MYNYVKYLLKSDSLLNPVFKLNVYFSIHDLHGTYSSWYCLIKSICVQQIFLFIQETVENIFNYLP